VSAFGNTTYSLTAPALNDDISDTIVIPNGHDPEGSFHTTSVISLDNINYIQYVYASMMNKVDMEVLPSIYDHISDNDLYYMNQMMKDDSLHTSVVAAFLKAGVDIEYDSYQALYLKFDYLTDNTLEVGDVIVDINGNTNFDEEFDNTTCGDTVTVHVLRNGEPKTYIIKKNEYEGECLFGLMIDTYTQITQTDGMYQFIPNNTGGPSGGLMQAIYVYNQLTEFDYSHGLKIAGTGTITALGEVGYIGGIRQKIITAIGNDIDIFFVPYLADTPDDNYIEALIAIEEFDTDMILVGVSSLDEALEYLESYGE
jgi:PDZ domain-containing protein